MRAQTSVRGARPRRGRCAFPESIFRGTVDRMASKRSLAWIACAHLTACVPSRDGPAIPSPTTERVSDAGSTIRVSLRPADGCPALQGRPRWGAGTVHGATVSGHETWSRAGSPHHAPHGVHVVAGATLTIERCAVVLVGTGADVVVQDDARLTAAGDRAAPILFDAEHDPPTAGDWIGLVIRKRALPDTHLAHAIVAHAGAELSERGEPRAAIRSSQSAGLSVDHVTVRASGGWGVALLDDAGFAADSRALSVIDSEGAGAVFFADADRVGTLPTSSFRSNSSNDVFIAARQREVRSDATWRNPGPDSRYRVRTSARIMVQGPDAPRLVIAPGTAVAFEEDSELDVGWEAPGALSADGGDASHRVVFSSASAPSNAARWVGVLFGERADTAHSRIRFARIDGAGSLATGDFNTCTAQGASRLEPRGMVFLQGVRGDGLISETEFTRGPADGYAILVAGDSPRPAEDFTESSRGNIFVHSGVRCVQSTAPVAGRCSPTPRCDSGIARSSNDEVADSTRLRRPDGGSNSSQP